MLFPWLMTMTQAIEDHENRSAPLETWIWLLVHQGKGGCHGQQCSLITCKLPSKKTKRSCKWCNSWLIGKEATHLALLLDFKSQAMLPCEISFSCCSHSHLTQMEQEASDKTLVGTVWGQCELCLDWFLDWQESEPHNGVAGQRVRTSTSLALQWKVR